MSEWRPIKTAPWYERVMAFDENWSDTEGSIQVVHRSSSGWHGVDFEFEPTHWMPLPEPPK